MNTSATTRSASEKLGAKSGMRCLVLHLPQELRSSPGLVPEHAATQLRGVFDHMLVFISRRSKLAQGLPRLKAHLRVGGMLWLAWPKARKLSSDLTLKEVIKVAYDSGLVESKTISVDASWSAIKLTHPREGVVYKNSYGRLPDPKPQRHTA